MGNRAQGVEQHTHVHGMTFAGEKAMFDANSTRQVISKIPMFDWPQIDGKTLTIYVDISGECDSNIEHTTVVGVDTEGHHYVLVSTHREV